MIIRVCTFTKQGEEKARQIFDNWQEMIPQYREADQPLGQWTGECFQKHLPILFVGACGIAVRAIAPYVRDKLLDCAVLVMDEKGDYVIPLLSGHVGGANELAKMMSERVGATPVITTATDVEDLFSVDVFAQKNGLRIANREGIRLVSGKLLRGETINITWEDGIEGEREGLPKGLRYVPFEEPFADVRIVTEDGYQALCHKMTEENLKQGTEQGETQALLLVAKEFVLGVGCRKGKEFPELQGFLEETLEGKDHAEKDLTKQAGEGESSRDPWERICAIASIDLKAREEGLWELAQFHHLPFLSFTAEQLKKVEGEFSGSEFVREITGIDNVCERAALCLAGPGGELTRRKIAGNGMTVAIAKRRVRLVF